jgi:hypothetical protein
MILEPYRAQEVQNGKIAVLRNRVDDHAHGD